MNIPLTSELFVRISRRKTNTESIYGNRLNVLVAVVFALVINSGIWRIYLQNNEITSFSNVVQMLSFFLFLFFIILALFSIFNFPVIQKTFLSLVILISVPAMYFILCHGVQYDQTMLHNILETDFNETIELLTMSFIIVFVLLAVFPILTIINAKVCYRKFLKQLMGNISSFLIFVVLALLSIYSHYAQLSSFVRNNNIQLSNSLLPIAPVRALYKNLVAVKSEMNIEKNILDPNAKTAAFSAVEDRKPFVLVVVVGETAREKSFSLKDVGMTGQRENLIGRQNTLYFDNFWSCGTNTALSVPCMFSLYSQKDYQRSMNREFENVAELSKRVGYDVSWRNNNSGCKGICNQLTRNPISKQDSKEFLHDGEYYDEVLVADLAKNIQLKKTDQILFLHQMGSHGPAYFKRVPPENKMLQPACESADFARCTRTEIINAYNNSVLYTKLTLNKAIDQLKSLDGDYDTMLIYLSDHGESTGENGFYLHGVPYFMAPEEQTHIPALMWISEGAVKQKGINFECVQAKQNSRLSHDNFSHTLMAILDIESQYLDKELDIFDGCRNLPI